MKSTLKWLLSLYVVIGSSPWFSKYTIVTQSVPALRGAASALPRGWFGRQSGRVTGRSSGICCSSANVYENRFGIAAGKI